MKVLFVPDVKQWAIGHLVDAKVKNMPQFRTEVFPVHPREAKQVAPFFLQAVKKFNPDVIVYEYFRSAEQLINDQPELKNYKSILVHHNQKPKALFHADWNELGIDQLITHTKKAAKKLKEKGYKSVKTINHGIDVKHFKYSNIEPELERVGYVGRIVPWKGLREIAIVSKDLGYEVLVMGKQDKPDYWNEIQKDNLDFAFFDCGDEDRVNAYHSMTVFVCNSEDDYEEGPLPLLEAMACGVPVITTPCGVAADIIVDGENGLVVPFGNDGELKLAIDRLMKDKDLRKKLRENAWRTVKDMTENKMALEYTDTIHEIVHDEPLVSVIIPATYDRIDNVKSILDALEDQSYNPLAIEAVICWDEKIDHFTLGKFEKAELKKPEQISARHVFTNQEGYNLAMARNLGAIEADGEYLMFCDSRLKPDQDSVNSFVIAAKELEASDSGKQKTWFFGDKGANKNAFVENFSFLKRIDYFTFGMMNERIDGYGGMSQDIRTRWIRQGGRFSYLPIAYADQMMSSGLSDKKRSELVDMKFKLLKMYKGESR